MGSGDDARVEKGRFWWITWQKGTPIRKFTNKHHLPIALITAILFAVIWPWPGEQFGTEVNDVSPTREIAIIVIFLLSGLKLTTDAVKEALTAVVAWSWGLISILFITVLIGIELTQQIDFPDVREFGIGLVIFFAMPTTVSSGIVLTQQAQGNYAVALFLTVASIFIAPFTIPLMLEWRADLGEGVELDAGSMIVKMCYRLLAPLIVGKLLSSSFEVIRVNVKKYKYSLKMVSIYCLVSMPWVTTSKAMDRGGLDSITFVSMLACIGWGFTMHLIFLVLNFTVTKLLRLPLPIQKAVVILASQKTLPISIVVIDALPEDAGEKSLMQMACIVAHLSQIVIDSIAISTYWGKSSAQVPPIKTNKMLAHEENDEENDEEKEDIELTPMVLDTVLNANDGSKRRVSLDIRLVSEV